MADQAPRQEGPAFSVDVLGHLSEQYAQALEYSVDTDIARVGNPESVITKFLNRVTGIFGISLIEPEFPPEVAVLVDPDKGIYVGIEKGKEDQINEHPYMVGKQ